jgi:hypothetical protein
MANESKKKLPGIDLEEKRANYDYIKSNYFRVIHVDGIFGGNSPRVGKIQMAIWNERWPIPRQAVYKIEQDGKIGAEIPEERLARNAIVREVEAQLLMDIGTAKAMRDWLGNKIAEFEKIKKTIPKGAR